VKFSKNSLIAIALIILSITLVGGTAYISSTRLPEILQKSESKDLDIPEPSSAQENRSEPDNRAEELTEATPARSGDVTRTPDSASSAHDPTPTATTIPKASQQCYQWKHEVKYSSTFAGKSDYYTQTTTQYAYKEPEAKPGMTGSGTKIISTTLLEKRAVSDEGKCG
jgi:hypothetical protein